MKNTINGKILANPVLAATLSLAIASTSQAYSGLELLEYCEAQTGSEPAGRCAGYIVGVSDMAFLQADNGKICPEGQVTREQAVQKVVSYLNAETQQLHRPAALLVVSGLANAYPCPGK